MSQRIEYFKKINDELIYFIFETNELSPHLSSIKPVYSLTSPVALIPFFNVDSLLKEGSLVINHFCLQKRSPGPYPIAVRYLTSTHAVIERPPFQIKVDYSPTKSSNRRKPIKPVTIWIPWTVLVADLRPDHFFSHSRIFFNDKPLESFDEKMATPYTSNVFNDSKICMGSISMASRMIEKSDYNALYHAYINEYFSGGWNADLDNGIYDVLTSTNPDKIPHFNGFTPIDSNIVDKLKNKKMSFYKSNSSSFQQANLYYALSLLSLEETLDLVSKYKEHTYRSYSLSDTLPKDSFSASYSSSFRNIPSSFYSDEYCNIKLNISNQKFEEIYESLKGLDYEVIREYKQNELLNLANFIASQVDAIAIETYNKIKSEKVSSVTFNYSTDLSINNGVNLNV
jgi:hypothetical protein